ncbi:Uncharacterised protein [Vibrio cholerae]|nr:Uncharacterised protein [Vibrio cholerae]CSC13655.1 Uncharacterised protein [Vibrio cholerae]CSI80221.1 Uncharacterised protein [Vibrio cholerae]
MDARKRGFASGGKYGEPSGSAKAENGSVSSDVCGRCGDRLNRSSGDGDQRWQLISQIEFLTRSSWQNHSADVVQYQ